MLSPLGQQRIEALNSDLPRARVELFHNILDRQFHYRLEVEATCAWDRSFIYFQIDEASLRLRVSSTPLA